jgi:hypothetical protein
MDVSYPKGIWKVPEDMSLEKIAGVQSLAGSCRATFLGKSKVILSFCNLGRGVQMWCGLKPAVGIPKESIGLGGSCLRMKATPQCKEEKSMTTKDRGMPVPLMDIWTEVIAVMEPACMTPIGPL